MPLQSASAKRGNPELGGIADVSEPLSAEGVKVLGGSHGQFLRFLQSRVGSREVAEDILQAAFVQTLERGEEIREQESAAAWFYRVLRNAIVDHFRHKAAALRCRTAAPKEAPPAEDPELEKAIGQCVKDILPTLKGEYADILQKGQMEGAAVTDVVSSRLAGPAPSTAASNAIARVRPGNRRSR